MDAEFFLSSNPPCVKLLAPAPVTTGDTPDRSAEHSAAPLRKYWERDLRRENSAQIDVYPGKVAEVIGKLHLQCARRFQAAVEAKPVYFIGL